VNYINKLIISYFYDNFNQYLHLNCKYLIHIFVGLYFTGGCFIINILFYYFSVYFIR